MTAELRNTSMGSEILSVNPWSTDEASFPGNGSRRDQLAFCVNYAVLAPSIHNTQPWLFRPLDNSIEMYVDRSRLLPAVDPNGREMTISCGAALTNLLVAIHRFGHEGWVQYFPEQGNSDLVARVRVGRPREVSHRDELLFRSIRRRHSVRRPFQPRPVPRELLRRLIWQASEFGCWVYFVEPGPGRDTIAELVEEAHHLQLDNLALQRERASWMGSGDNGYRRQTDSVLSSELAAGQRWMERDRELVKSSPVLVTLGASDDTPRDWLRAGEAMQHVLLRAACENVSASFLNQPCQVPELRERLRVITGRSGPPQLLLRMGYGDGTDPTPRRPVSDVILPSLPV
jgi:hypothetical protein